MRSIVLAAVALGPLGGCAPDDFRYTRSSDDGCRDDSCSAVPDAASCAAPWSSPIADVEPRALSADASRLWVAGELARDGRDPVAWVGRLGACAGELELNAPVSVVPSTLGAIAAAEHGIFAAGAREGDAWLVELDSDTLATKSQITHPGASFGALARSGDLLWAGGTTGDPARAFALRWLPPNAPCTLELAAGPSAISSLATTTAGIFAAGSQVSGAAVFPLNPAGCETPPQAFTGLLPAGATSGEARAIVVVDAELYIGGRAEMGAGAVGFVLAVSADGSPGASVIVDQGVTALATDGARLFVGGYAGPEAALDAPSSATLAAHTLPLGTAAPSFTHTWPEAGVVSALAFESETSSLYATLYRAGGSASIVRCTANGSCP